MRTYPLLAALIALTAPPGMARAAVPLLGLVSISANEANNHRFIEGATKQAQAQGWTVSVIDAAGSADQANGAMQNLVQRGAAGIIDLVFPVSSLGAGLAATRAAHMPVATWGGGLGAGVVATDGSGGPLATPIVNMIVHDLSGKGAVLALTYHTGQVCREREQVFDRIMAASPGIKVTKDEVRIPGFFQDGAQYATAWLASHPAGSEKLAIWGCWDDPAIGAISALRQQARTDVRVYGENGNAQALAAIKSGTMTATAWQDSATEGTRLVEAIDAAIKQGSRWQPQTVDVPPVIVTRANIDQFAAAHPDAVR